MAVVDYSPLFRAIGYEFKSLDYLKQALTHRSAAALNNERLEFLGDSILSFVISSQLYEMFSSQSEGKLSRLRAHLVKGDALAEIAREINLGDFLILGVGELRSGGHRRTSILADALEAIFAAVYLDGGLDSVRQVILKLFHSRLYDPELNDSLKDAKTRLQEHLQAQKIALPEYEVAAIVGNETDQTFQVRCRVVSLKQETNGEGTTRRKAEQAAAKAMIKKLKI